MQKELKTKIKKGAIIGGIVGLSYAGTTLGLDIAFGETVKNLEYILKEAAFITSGAGLGAIGGTAFHYLDRAHECVMNKIDAYFLKLNEKYFNKSKY